MKKENRYAFAIKIFLPAILTVVLFIISFFWIVIPSFEKNMMDRKRETIYELTQTACSILDKYNREVIAGNLELPEAQQKAADEIGELRYGAENKDYFWITDMHPNMIRHPYRTDLNDHDLSNFEDPQGKKLFVEFVKTVEQSNEGYVDYMWQWKDDSTRIVPKLSYVRGFKPWGWIVGTGIYIEDVKTEIARLEQRLFIVSVIITVLIVLLLTFVMRLSLKADRKRKQAEKNLQNSRDRYKALVEASTEGTVMLLADYVYANKSFLNMTGIEESKLSFDGIFDLLHFDTLFACERNDFDRCASAFSSPQKAETIITQGNGDKINVLLNCSLATLMGKEAIIVIARSINQNQKQSSNTLEGILPMLKIGTFVATFSRRSRFIDFNSYLVQILGADSREEILNSNIDSLFADNFERQHFLKTLVNQHRINDYSVKILRPDRSAFSASISATLSTDELSGDTICTGIITPTGHVKDKLELTEKILIESQASQILLHQAVDVFAQSPKWCNQSDSLDVAIKQMCSDNIDMLVVKSPDGEMIGLVYLSDIMNQIVEGEDLNSKPVHSVMHAPLPTIKNDISLLDALILSSKTKQKYFIVKQGKNELNKLLNIADIPLLDAIYSENLIKSIETETNIAQIAEIYNKYRSIVGLLIRSGLSSFRATQMLSRFSNAVIARLNTMAIEQLGKAPCDYVYITLGSVGRGEQTLATDQDNAIIFADTEHNEENKKYFSELGLRISNWLNRIGYELCKGNMMASNPRWCTSLLEWKSYFKEWLNNSEPKNLLEISVFFDFNPVYGNNEIAIELRNFIDNESKNKGAFYFNLAQSIMQFKPPLNLLGNIVSDSTSHQDSLDIKNAIAPLVMMIRLYAIQSGLSETNTIDRLRKLEANNIFNKSFAQEFNFNYLHLMDLRLQHQLEQIDNGKTPDNYINSRQLSETERVLIKRIFSQYSAYQSKIGYEFTGNRG